MNDTFDWDAPPLAPDDVRLVSAYQSAGRSLDYLAYTQDFEVLMRKLEEPDTLEAKHRVYHRLLQLRKMGRLPRLGRRESA